MKTFIKYITLSTIALTAGLTLAAQTLPEGTYEGQNGIAYRKSSSLKPGTNDTYIVNLETFVYGEVTVKNEAIPADIILVLDVSGSMDETMYRYSYTARSSQEYTYNGYGNNTYYYKFNDKYYPVSRSDDYSWYVIFTVHRYYLTFTADGTTYYLTGNTVSTTAPSNPPGGANDTIWTGVLYTRTQQNLGSKLANLKTAVNSFIDQIVKNDLYEDEAGTIRRKDAGGHDTALGNQISIVKFAMDDYYTGNDTYDNASASITEGNHFTDSDYNYTEVVKALTPTATETNVTALKSAVNSLQQGGATAGDFGLNLACRLLQDLKDKGERAGSSKTVVFFTDGSPTYGNNFQTNVATKAINRAYQLKNTYDATVFTIGVFSEEDDDVDTYMNYVSSNYPNATQFTQGGTPVPAAQRNYYQNASGVNLSEVFQVVAQASGGSGSTEVTSDAAVTVDVVASSFSIPATVTADDITVTIAPCTGQTKDKEEQADGKVRLYYTFGQAKEATQYLGSGKAITATVDAAHNMVSTTGFDFAEHWCGKDETLTPPNNFRGYKQIISFEIKLNEDAVGGHDVPTNDSKSGIYVNGVQVATFNRPVVKIPISLWIKKKGLIDEDSAVFTIEYAEWQEGVNPTTLDKSAWKSFTKVMVNSNCPIDSDGYPVVKIVGLDPDYFYRIREDKWAWTYNYVDNGIQYAFGEDQHNPFVFQNNPKDSIKSAEASVKNEFNEKTAPAAETK